MSNKFRTIPDYQELVRKKEVDSTGKYIETKKSKSYKYKVKIIKDGLRMTNKKSILEFNEISMHSGKAILPIMNLIYGNSNRHNILSYDGTAVTTSSLMSLAGNVSRPTVSKYIKKLTDAELIKRHKKNFMLSPYVFYPYVSDLNLKILQEYWDSDFKKSKEVIASEIQVEVESMLSDAKDFMSVSSSEFEKIKNVKDLL